MKKFGHYEVTAELGRGGMGVVYKGWDPTLNRNVAIKALGEHLLNDKDLTERFTREAKATAALNDPNVIQIYFIGEEQGQPYFSMEFIEGESLDEILKGNKTLSTTHAKSLLHQACNGLSAAHKLDLVHRDIKPANIMITHDGTLKIVDFGIARTREYGEKLTNTGEFVGTPGYLSPEVCIGQEVDLRSDIFSLGIVFYEMLAGKVPFENDSPLGLMLEVVQADIPDIRELNKKVDKKTSFILNKMIAKSTDDRYQNCDDIIRDIGNVIEKQPLKTIKENAQVAKNTSQKISQQITLPGIEAITQANPTLSQKQSKSKVLPIAASLFVVAMTAAGIGYYQGFFTSKPEPVQKTALLNSESIKEKEQEPIVTENTIANKPDLELQKSASIENTEKSEIQTAQINSQEHHVNEVQATAQPSGFQIETVEPENIEASNENSNLALSNIEKTPENTVAMNSNPIVKKPQKQFSSFNKNTSAHLTKIQEKAKSLSKAKPQILNQGVAVIAFGDPAVANPIEKHLESELAKGGIKVMNEQFISGMSDLLRNGADLAEIKSLIKRNGGQAMIIANVNETGTQQLSYSGRTSTLINAQIDIDTYDIKTGEMLDPGFGGDINYTSLNASQEAIDTIINYSQELKTVLKSKINS